MHICS